MRNFTKVVLKIISLSVMLRSLAFVQELVTFLIMGSNSSVSTPILAYAVFSFLSCLFLGVLIWVFAEKISLLIIKKEEAGFNIDLPIKQLLRAAIVVLGIYILVNSIPSIIGDIYNYISMQNQIKDQVDGLSFIRAKSAIITDFIKIVIAIFIIAGHKWIVKFTDYLKVEERQDQEENSNMDKNDS